MRAVLQIAVLTLASICLGCGGGASPDDAVAAANSTNIKRLSNLYVAFQSTHDWRGPKDESELKDFIRTVGADRLARINVDPNAVDSIFISENDGQPFKIRWSVRGSAMASSEPVVFESAGVEGKYQVGRLNMVVESVDQPTYDALWSGKAAPAGDGRQ